MANPYLIGSATGSGGATLTVPVTTATGAGDKIVVGVDGTNGSIAGVTDTKGNSYTPKKSDAGGTAGILSALYVADGATLALTATDTISVSFTGGTINYAAIAVGVPGLVTTAWDVGNVIDNGGSTATSVSTPSGLAQASEVVIAMSASQGTGGSPTWTSPFTAISTQRSGSGPYLSLAYQVVSSASAVTAAVTISSGAKWAMMIGSFKQSTTLSVSTQSLPPATQGFPYPATQLQANGGSGSYTWSVISGTVPTGITVPSGGLITGTPSVSGNFPVTVQVSDGVTTATAALTFVISPPVTSGAPYLAGSASAASGGLTTLNVPIGANVSDRDSVLVGVLVTSAGVTVTVGPDTAGNVYGLVNSDTGNASAQLWTFECDGCAVLKAGIDSIPVSYSTNASVQGAVAVGDNNVSGVDKAVIAHGTSTAPASPSSGLLSQVEENAIAFIVDANAGGIPTWASPWSGHILANVQAAATARISAAYQQVTSRTALTASGTITSAAWAAGLITHAVSPVSVGTILSGTVVGDPYSQSLKATGGMSPYSWSVSGLPPGLTLTGNVISGVTTEPGSFDVVISVADVQGVTDTDTDTIIILPNPVTAAPFITYPNNLLTPADANMSVPGFTWATAANAGAPFASPQTWLTGNQSLTWASLADGPTSVHTGFYNIRPGQPYICSGFILPATARDCQIGIEWYTSGSVLIRTDQGPDNPSGTIAWQPLVFAGTAPANAAKCRVVVTVQESNAGDVTHLDLLYLTQSDIQVLIDWTNSPFGAASTAGDDFMDVSAFVRMDQGVSITRGRRDAVSEIQPSSVSFTLQNDTGMFSRDKSTSIVNAIGGSMTLKRRLQVNTCDEFGTWYTRADGTISDAQPATDPIGNTAIVPVTGTDILAGLNLHGSLDSWTEEAVMNDGPLYHWCLTDPGNAGGAGVLAETSGNGGPPMRTLNTDNTTGSVSAVPNRITFQDTAGGTETLADASAPGKPDGSQYWSAGSNRPSSALRGLDSGAAGPYTTPEGSVNLTPLLTTQSTQNQFIGNIGYQVQAQVPVLDPTASNYSFECWFTVDPAVGQAALSNYGPYIAMSLGSARSGNTLVAGIFLAGGTPYTFQVATYTQPPAFLGSNWPGSPPPAVVASASTPFAVDAVRLPHHLVITISKSPTAPSVTAFLDGVQVGTPFTLTASQVFDTFALGGAYGGKGCWFGSLQHASIYDYILPNTQIVTHCQMGQYGMWEQTTDDCITKIAEYAGVPPFWNNLAGNHDGLTLAEYQSIAGVGPVNAMQSFEQAEGGLLFTDAAGKLNFHTRDWRMGHGAPDLYLPPDTFDPDLGYGVTDQFMVNEMAVSSAIFQSGTSQVNLDSQEKYGLYSTSTAAAPTELPLISWSRAYFQLGLPSFNYFPDPNFDDVAAWTVNSRSEPWYLPANVTIDLLTLNKTSTGLGISDFYALEIDDIIAPSGALPASFPDGNLSMEWFIEGVAETISFNARTIQFYCSPAEPQRAWVPGDPVYGALDSTARIGISAADTSAIQADGKDVAHDAGRPYWPPTFIAGMNNPSGNNQGFIGGLDIRGLTDNLSLALQPPMACVGVINKTQTMPNGSNSSPQIFWDQVFVDTVGGMGAVPGWPNWYVCLVPGFYDIDASLVWGASGAAAGTTAQGWIVVAMQAAQALFAGTGTPITVQNYIHPVGEQVRVSAVGLNMVNAPSVRLYLGLGDMVTVAGEQDTGSSKGTGTNYGGSRFSLIWRGFSRTDDRAMLNSLITGGTVAAAHTVATYTKVYNNSHTYTYRGSGGFPPNSRRNTDGTVFQGQYPGGGDGVQWSEIAFGGGTAIHNDLNPGGGSTVKINYVTLSAGNLTTWYPTGNKMMLGWSTQSPGKSIQDPNSIASKDVFEEPFARGQTKTFSIPNSFAAAFQQATPAQMLIVGDAGNKDLNYYGTWAGGPGKWTLTINYTVTT